MKAFKFTIALAALSAVGQFAAAGAAQAQVYVSGNIGGMFVADPDLEESAPVYAGTGSLGLDPGWGVNGALGHAWGLFRVEGEISYRMAELDSLTVDSLTAAGLTLTGLGTFPISGDMSILAFLANGWRDFKTGTDFKPYIGGGIGIANVGFDLGAAEDDDWVFAYQAGVGLGYELTKNVTASLGYRFFGTTTAEYSTQTAAFGTVTDDVGPIYTHNIELGFRVSF